MEEKCLQINTINKNFPKPTRSLSSDSVWNPIEAEGMITHQMDNFINL